MKIGNKKISSLTAIILAGGKSSRMGSDKNKSMLRLNGKYLIDIVRSKLKCVVGDNIIIVGPQYMTENINSNDIVIPRYGDGYIEPLCAIYSKKCLETIERNLAEHIFSVRAIFPHLKVKFIEDDEIKKYDPEFYSFFNINYKKDIIEAEKIINNRRE